MALAGKKSKAAYYKRTGYIYKPSYNKYHPGVEIVLNKTNKPALIQKPDPKKPGHTGSFWNGDKKVEVATMYAVLQDVEETAKICGVYPYVIRQWKNELWFNQIQKDVRKEKNEKLDAKITEVLTQAVDLITDRILNGEYIYNANTGEFRRQPLKARDGAYVTEVLFNKRQLLRGEATSRTDTASFDDKLKALKNKFEDLAGKTINGTAEVITNESTQESGNGEEAGTDSEGALQVQSEAETSGCEEEVSFIAPFGVTDLRQL
jgi:hypothetical protein